jgi:hypothetical protein
MKNAPTTDYNSKPLAVKQKSFVIQPVTVGVFPQAFDTVGFAALLSLKTEAPPAPS